ncbi:MAG TPA: transposase [Thermoanaerobaculia bacterium]|nr:transposase [Thermoanaerobaculia bacterium]
MSRPLRLEFPGSLWHVTSRGNEKRDIAYDDADRRTFVKLLGETVAQFDWLLYSWTLMTNHYHLVLELRRKTLARGLHWLNSTYVRRFNRRHDRVGHLFQSRPNCILVQKESHWLELMRYVVLNPVRARMVEHPRDYAWSSYGATAGDAPAPPWLAVRHGLPAFGPTVESARAEYRHFVESGIGATVCPWDQLTGQIYLGSDTWMEQVREEVRKKPRSDDHPRAQLIPVSTSMADVIAAVSSESGLAADSIRHGRGGIERMASAWIARHEGNLELRSIAAGLRVQSAAQASRLVKQCDLMLGDNSVRMLVDRSLRTLRGLEKGKREGLTPI